MLLGISIPLLTACSSSSSADENGMRTAIQMKAKDEGYENAKFPFFKEDYHFEKTSEGTFKNNGKEYSYTAEVNPESDLVLDFYVE
jgi:hypothetical protein